MTPSARRPRRHRFLLACSLLLVAAGLGRPLAAQSPRLVPINVQLTTGINYCAGGSITVAYDVCNNGNAPIFSNSSWSDRVLLNSTRSTVGAITSRTIPRFTGSPGCPVGCCYSQFNPPINLPSTLSIPSNIARGVYYVGYQANSNNALPGGSTTVWVQINIETLPDFTGDSISIATSPLMPGGPLQILFTLRNGGGDCRNGFIQGSVYIAPRNTFPGTLLGNTTPTFLSPGIARQFGGTLTIPSQLGLGDYDLHLVADGANAVLESNENNNRTTVPICLGPLADYVSFGTACAGPNSQVIGVQPSTAARPGTSLTIDASGGTPGLLGVLFLGLAPTAVDLTVIGMPNCWLNVSPLSSHGALFDVAGSHSFPFAIPNDSALIGASVFVQVAGQSPGSNALGFITSQGGELKIGC